MKKERIVQLETNIDHLTGEEIGIVLEELNAMPEVLDAIWLSAVGKKNRPCGVLQVLCHPGYEEKAALAVFRHTHSLGLRRMELERYVLERQTAEIATGGKMFPAKIYELEGQGYIRPESDFIREEARKMGVGAPALRILKKDDC